LFELTDFDLNGDSAGDFASGSVDGILQQKAGTTAFVSSSLPPDAFQISAFSDIRDALNDGSFTNLDNSGSPSGPDDLQHAFQWNLSLDPGERVAFQKTKDVNVPEPAATVLVLAGLVGGAIARRRRVRQNSDK
jgi:hypothetical protein